MKIRILPIVLLSALFVMLSLPAMAQVAPINGWCSQGATQAQISGLKSTNYLNGIVPSCTVTVYLSGTTNLATLYSDSSLTPLANPFTATDKNSVAPGYWLAYAPVGPTYDVVLSGGIAPNTYAVPVTVKRVLGASYPGVTSDGANGLTVTGSVAAGTTVSAKNIVTNLNGADNTGGTDVSAAVNAAIAANVKHIILPAGQFFAPSLSNINGTQIDGDGILLKSINQMTQNGSGANVYATKAQQNSYAYNNRLVFGQEYMSHWLGMVNNFQTNTGGIPPTGISVVFSGDSTTSGVNVSGIFTVDQMFAYSALAKGIQGVKTVNAGHSGMSSSTWLSTYLAADQATNPDVYVIRWCINDAFYGGTAAGCIANIRAGLAIIRAAKSVDQETIVVETPSSTNDNPNGRAPIFYEQLRNGLAQAARDYQAVFIDLYGAMPDNDFAQQTCMMDLPYASSGTPPVHIHPGNCKNPLYNNILADTLLSPVQIIASNLDINVSGQVLTPLVTVPPSSYAWGSSQYRTGDDWPYNGAALGFHQADGVWLQFNYPYNSPVSALAYRTQYQGVWNPWVTPAPTNSPAFTGSPTAPTPLATDNSTTVATTAFVKSQLQVLRVFLNTTAATSDVLSLPGMTSSGMCSIGAANASAAANIATTYIYAPGTNQITVNHAAIASMYYYFLCTAN